MHFEAISFLNENTPPPAWELNEKQKPKGHANVKKCAQALEFFNRNPQWIASNMEIVREYALLISKTDFSWESWPVSVPKIKELFMEIFPDLFPSTIVVIGEVSRKMLNERLAKISPKFKEMIDSSSWGLRIQIVLDMPEGMDSRTIHNCADYLFSEKKIAIHSENVFLLLLLASMNRIPELERACRDFLSQELTFDIDNLGAVVNFASLHNLGDTSEDLKRKCFEIATKNASNPVVQSLFESEDLCPEAKLILKTAIANGELAQHNTGFGVEYSCFQNLILKGYGYLKIDERVLAVIASIQKFSLPIKYLDISIIGIDNSDLEKLCDLLPNLEQIDLTNAKITELPNRWLESLDFVRIKGCMLLKKLVLPNATYVKFTECNALESIEAPQAKNVFFTNCKVLVTSKVSEKTRSAFYQECEALEEVEAMNAFDLHFHICRSLKKIEAPGTKEIYFSKCPSIKEIKVAGGCYFDRPLPAHCQLTCVGKGDPKFNPCPVQ